MMLGELAAAMMFNLNQNAQKQIEYEAQVLRVLEKFSELVKHLQSRIDEKDARIEELTMMVQELTAQNERKSDNTIVTPSMTGSTRGRNG